MNYAHSTLTLLLLSACGRGTPCEESTDCGSTEVCVQETCAYAFDRFYDVVIIRSEVPNTNADGGAWDDGSNAPDPFAEVGFSGSGEGCFTPTVFDTTEPFWEEICPIWVPDHGTFLVNVWDEDVGSEDQFIAGFYWEGAASFIDLLKSDGNAISVRDEYDSATLELTFLP